MRDMLPSSADAAVTLLPSHCCRHIADQEQAAPISNRRHQNELRTLVPAAAALAQFDERLNQRSHPSGGRH